MRLVIAALAVGVILAPAAAAQVVVSEAVEAGAEVETVEAARVWPYASFGEAVPLARGMELAAGDLLGGDGAGLEVELACPGGSRLRFQGPFRAQIVAPTAGLDCAVDLAAGAVEVAAVGGTEVRSGGLVAASGAGRYEVGVEPAAGAEELSVASAGGLGAGEEGAIPAAAAPPATVHQRVQVFAGEVKVRTPGGEVRVTAGRSLTVDAPRGAPERAVLAEGPIAGERVAERQAASSAASEAGAPAEAPSSGGEPAPVTGTSTPEGPEAGGSAATRPAPEGSAVGASTASGPGTPGPEAPRAEEAAREAATEPAPQAAPGHQAAPAAPAAAAPPAPAPVDLDEIRRWLDEERYREVIQALEPRITAGQPTSVECYLLARAHAGLEDWRRGSALARRALRLDEIDNLLTSRELAAAQNLEDGQPPRKDRRP